MKTVLPSTAVLSICASLVILSGCGATKQVNVEVNSNGSGRVATGSADTTGTIETTGAMVATGTRPQYTGTTVQNTDTTKPEVEKPAPTSPTPEAEKPVPTTSAPAENTGNGTTAKEPTKVKGYTLEQVQAHSAESSCRAIVGNSVYDLSAWINQHPGGDRNILKMCGRDATSMYERQHGGQTQAEQILAGFRIGNYAK